MPYTSDRHRITLRRLAPGAALTAALLLAAFGAACSGEGGALKRARKAFAQPQHVVVVTLDTFRADRLAPWGGDPALAPELDRIAAEGLVFTHAYATNPVTFPSHCSMFTGRWPFRHGMRDNGSEHLPDGEKTLAESYKDAGYATSAFISAFPLTRTFGIAQGFDHYDDTLDARAGDSPLDVERLGNHTLDAFERHWDSRPADARTFDWVHLYDAHFPYHAEARFQAPGRTPYDAEIAQVDAQVGRLVKFLAGRPGKTLVVFAGDHGEGLGEHGEDTHGFLLYDPMTRVPFIFWSPGGAVKGTVSRTVSLVDLAPTLLALSGLAGQDMDGVDLLAGAPARAVYMEAMSPYLRYGAAPSTAAVEDGWKLIAGPLPEMYGLEKDPGEASNLYFREPARAQALEAERAGFGSTMPGVSTTKLADEEVEALLALGYVGTTLDKLPDNPTMDVKDFVAVFNEMQSAMRLLEARKPDVACAKMAAVVEKLPEVPTAHRNYGKALGAAGRFEEALVQFERAIELNDQGVGSWVGRGNCRSELGMNELALEDYAKALSIDPDAASALSGLGITLESMGDVEGAKDAYLRYLKVARSEPERKRMVERLEMLGVTLPPDAAAVPQ